MGMEEKQQGGTDDGSTLRSGMKTTKSLEAEFTETDSARQRCIRKTTRLKTGAT
jgi:hypothetical protein